MWLEIEYTLRTENSKRYLIIKSNSITEDNQRSFTDNGIYTIIEDFTSYYGMTDEEIRSHRDAAYDWDKGEYSGADTLGILQVDLENDYSFVWDGQEDAFTESELTEVVTFIVNYDESGD